jgi:hypothetical protein
MAQVTLRSLAQVLDPLLHDVRYRLLTFFESDDDTLHLLSQIASAIYIFP